jgi:aminomuconate-semialdehyde/2-hydroxymuconate-6-semialdehyde dehydrogenase
VDLDRCVDECIVSAFTNNGQVCLCTSRIFIQDTIYEAFKNKYVQKVKTLKVGDPFDAATKISAVASKPHMEKILSYAKVAIEEGGTIECGGAAALMAQSEMQNGYFIQPTVITGLHYQSRCMQEEIFGPFVCLAPFSSMEEGIHMTNSTKYGLCASVWTENLARAHKVANQIQVGTVWINCWKVRDLNLPFGGMKQSGIGREGWPCSEEFFTEQKAVCVSLESNM